MRHKLVSAAVLQCGEHQRVLQGSTVDTTVNAMELTAIVEALDDFWNK